MLVVDDEPDIRHAIAESLEGALDCVVLTAPSGPRALQILQTAPQETLDLIISDLRMAPMDGATFLRQAARTHPDTPRILMSAYPEVGDEARSVGVVVALSKPFAPEALLEATRRVLAQRAAARASAAATGPAGARAV